MAQETAFEKAPSGHFVAPSVKPGLNITLHRHGVENLEPGALTEYTPWERVLRIDVHRDYAEWILKEPCECGALEGNFYNPECKKCDGFGNAEGKKVMVPHDPSDDQSLDWYIHLEGATMFWARQSGAKIRLRSGTPVFNLDVPRVKFLCMTKKNKVSSDDLVLPAEYGGSSVMQRKRSFAYHDEMRQEMLQIRMERESMLAKDG
jgi:hypothetical protein